MDAAGAVHPNGLSRHNLNLRTPVMTDDKIALRELLG